LLRKRFRSGIKVLSVQDLERLTDAAVAHPKWSATGRPDWLRENRDQITHVCLTFYDMDGTDALRCLVMVELDDRTKGRFTLDISPRDYRRLPDMPIRGLAQRYLGTFPSIPLDPAQQKEWERSADTGI
jgi:hypothetical protein